MNNVKKAVALLLALALIFAFPVTASAAETTEARVPVTLTVVNTVSPISCTVPACVPVSLIDGYVVCANNAAITNTGKTGAIRVTKVDVQAGTFEIGSYDDFSASKNSIALNINGCSTKGAGSLTLVDGAFPAIAAEKNLAIRYKAKVSANEAVPAPAMVTEAIRAPAVRPRVRRSIPAAIVTVMEAGSSIRPVSTGAPVLAVTVVQRIMIMPATA